MSMKPDILVVDDEEGIRFLLTRLLEQEGFGVTTAKNGLDALSKINEQPFDLIILDYHLPILDGVGVIKQLEKDQILIPIILLSGLTEHIDEDLLIKGPVKEIISKPFNVFEFRDLVKSTII